MSSHFDDLVRQACEATNDKERRTLIDAAIEVANQEYYDSAPDPTRPNPVANLRRACVFHLRWLATVDAKPSGFMGFSKISSPIDDFRKEMWGLYESGRVKVKPPRIPDLIPTGLDEPYTASAREVTKTILDWCDQTSAQLPEAEIPVGSRIDRGKSPGLRPRWDGNQRTLYLGNTVLKTYGKNPAERQIDLLEAFERAGWLDESGNPVNIPDPFKAADTLRQTIKDLNKTLPAGSIRFHADGTGEGVRWGQA